MMTKHIGALAAIVALLFFAAPASAGIVQSKSSSASSGNGVLTLTTTPTVGNLIIECAGANNDPFAVLNTTSWTAIAHGGSSPGFVTCAYRYVQPGDTTSLPNLTSSNIGFQSNEAIELSGVSGTIGTDLESTDAQYNQTTATVSLGTLTTAHNLDLVLIAGFNYDASGNLSISAPWLPQELNNNFGNYGAWAFWQQTFASSGSSVMATMTPNTTSHPFGYIAMVLNGIGTLPTQESSSKMNAYPVLQIATPNDVNETKANAYFVLQYSTSMSKANAYVVLSTVANPNKLPFHVFP